MRCSTTLIALSALVLQTLASNDVERRDAPAARISNANTPPVTTKGNAFFANNKRFYIRGVDYQPGGDSGNIDPLAKLSDCSRDIKEFTKLGINTVRIYAIDNSVNHDDCMKALADAGIYVALDVNTHGYSLNRDNPYTIRMSYNDVYLQSVFSTVEQFSKYDNTLLFLSANEVVNAQNDTFGAPYIKAVGRDIKQYVKTRGLRAVPVGYAAADVAENGVFMAHYLNCDTDDVRSDFFAFNDYSWCAPSSFTISHWDQKVKNFTDYGLPLFLSEYGCNKNKRDFGEVASLYSSNMTGVYSGGLSYEYSMGPNGYGLVNIDSSGQLTELADMNVLTQAFKNTPIPSGDGGYNANTKVSQCPPSGVDWAVTNTSLPIFPSNAAQYMTNGAGVGPGFNKDPKYPNGSQWAGTPSPGFGPGTSTSGTSGTSGSGSTAGGAKKSGAILGAAPGMSMVVFVFGFLYLLL